MVPSVSSSPDLLLHTLLELAADTDHGAEPSQAHPGLSRGELERCFFEAVGPARREEATEVLRIGRVSWRLRNDDNLLLSRVESQLLRRRSGSGPAAWGGPPAGRATTKSRSDPRNCRRAPRRLAHTVGIPRRTSGGVRVPQPSPGSTSAAHRPTRLARLGERQGAPDHRGGRHQRVSCWRSAGMRRHSADDDAPGPLGCGHCGTARRHADPRCDHRARWGFLTSTGSFAPSSC